MLTWLMYKHEWPSLGTWLRLFISNYNKTETQMLKLCKKVI